MKNLTDIAAERAILCGLYQYGQDISIDIEDLITSDCFTDIKNQAIYKCLEKGLLDSTYVDKSTLLSKAHELGMYQQINNDADLEFINSLDRFVIEKDNVVPLAKKLLRLRIARDLNKELYVAKNELAEVTGVESLDKILSIAENRILDFCENVGERDENKIERFGDDIHELLKFLVENRSNVAGIPTGFSKWDEAIGGGPRRRGVSLFGARTGVGKSTLACQISLNVSRNQNIPVLILDSEMSKNDMLYKQLANISGIDTKQIELGHFGDDNDRLRRVKEAGDEIETLPLYYKNIAGEDFESILPYIRRWIKREVGYDDNGRVNDCVIVYDYFKLMDGNKLTDSFQEYQALGFQLSRMVNFCNRNDVTCIAFVQLNKEGIVSQSDRLNWFAESVSYLLEKTQDEIATDGPENGNLKIVISKKRYGAGLPDSDYINVLRQGEIARMEELSTRNEIRKDRS